MTEELRCNGKTEKCSIGEAALILCTLGVPNPYYNIEDPAGIIKKSLKEKERLYPSQSDAFTYFRTGNLKAEGVVIYRHTSVLDETDSFTSYIEEKIQEGKKKNGQMELPL